MAGISMEDNFTLNASLSTDIFQPLLNLFGLSFYEGLPQIYLNKWICWLYRVIKPHTMKYVASYHVITLPCTTLWRNFDVTIKTTTHSRHHSNIMHTLCIASQ